MILNDLAEIEFGTQRSQVQILSRRRYKDSGTWVRESLAGAAPEVFSGKLLGFFFALKSFYLITALGVSPCFHKEKACHFHVKKEFSTWNKLKVRAGATVVKTDDCCYNI